MGHNGKTPWAWPQGKFVLLIYTSFEECSKFHSDDKKTRRCLRHIKFAV